MDLVDKGAEKEIVKIMMNPNAYKVNLLILVKCVDIFGMRMDPESEVEILSQTKGIQG